MKIRPVGWAALLSMVLVLCGTAVSCVALATHQASIKDIEAAGGSLVGAIVMLVLVVVLFAE